eukprot:SAG22_NODE_130_length_18670_cov_12.091379_18_plen_62_part_00
MACVVAVPHPRWDERPVAIVQLAPGTALTDAPTKAQMDEHLLANREDEGTAVLLCFHCLSI